MRLKRISAFILIALVLGFVAAPAAVHRQIIFSPLAILEDPAYFKYDHATDTWSLDEVKANELFCAVSNALEPMPPNTKKGIRILAWGPWEDHPYGLSSQFQPYSMNPERTKFDLAHFNKWYFPLARRFIEIAKAYDLTTWFVLGDNCQFIGGYGKWSPWFNNTQGTANFYETRAFPYFKKWFEKCLDEFAGLGVCWAWGNETNRKQMVDLAKAAVFPVIKARGLDWKDMTYGATMEDVDYFPPPAPEQYPGSAGTLDVLKKILGDTYGDAAKLSVWKEVHGVGGKGYPVPPNRYHQAMYWWARKGANNGIRIWLSDDGVFDAESKCDVATEPGHPIGRRPSAERMAEIVKASILYGNDLTFESLPKTADMACVTTTLRAMYKAMTGKDPVPKWHYEPPIVPPEYVTVTICKGSGLRPNPYCPETASQKYVKGTEPTKACAVHKKPEPPPPPPPDEPPVITPPAPECSCGAWLDTEGGKRKRDWARWISCLFGGKKRCR